MVMVNVLYATVNSKNAIYRLTTEFHMKSEAIWPLEIETLKTSCYYVVRAIEQNLGAVSTAKIGKA